MSILEIVLFALVFFIIIVLWVNVKMILEKVDSSLKWLAWLELSLKDKGLLDSKKDSLKNRE